MGLVQRIHDYAKSKTPPDSVGIIENIAAGVSHKSAGTADHVWADYFFVAACYAAASGNAPQIQKLHEQIEKDFPNYDPAKRFTYGRMKMEGGPTPDLVTQLQHVLPVIGAMNKFCITHPDFSFAEKLGQYFPGAKAMTVKKDPPQTQQ